MADRPRTLLCSVITLLVVLSATSGQAVIIASGDGTGNTTAPPDDPGWDYLVGELAGLLIGVETYAGQPAAALYSNKTYAADLSVYRDEILDIVALPEPGAASGPLAGAGFVLLLGRRRIRR